MFVDTEFTHVADMMERTITRNDIVFQHLHYSVTKEGKDSISSRADNTWNDGKMLYLKRFHDNFGIPDANKWNISDDAHAMWLKRSLRMIS